MPCTNVLWLKSVPLKIAGVELLSQTEGKASWQHTILLEDLLLDELMGVYRLIMESIW